MRSAQLLRQKPSHPGAIHCILKSWQKKFKDEDIDGSDTDVRTWASVTLPVIKHHLLLSEDLSVDLDKNKGKNNRPDHGSRSRTGAEKTSTLK